MTDLCFHYTLRGSLVAPEGSRLNDTATGVILPDGKTLKIWEQFETQTEGQDDYRNLNDVELNDMGVFYDGDSCRFEEPAPITEGDTIWPRP